MLLNKLTSIQDKNNSLVCIGLDSDPGEISYDSQFSFNKSIIVSTHQLVCAYKPNTAFYEAQGDKGIGQLKLTCDYIKENHPDIFLIIDAKRGDIGSTSEAYARFVFDYLGADAVTLNPYLGAEALKPFIEREDKVNIILCRTSNSGAGEFQDLIVDGKPLWQHVATRIATVWNGRGNCMLVAGATYPEELQIIREIVGDMPLLVPGIGAQGGDIEAVMKVGLDSQGRGLVINSSRGIISATDPALEAQMLRDTINQYR